MQKSKIILFTGWLVIVLFSACLLQASNKNPYSYLPKPPIQVNYIITPDKAIYERGEEIDFAILIMLDSLLCNPFCDYRVYLGNLKNLLTNCELVDSEVYDYYELNTQKLATVIYFKVRMLNRNNPPYIAVKAVRIAPEDATAKKQFLDIVIDQYSIFYVTPPEYQKVRNTGYINKNY
jgi:hypothetical protein